MSALVIVDYGMGNISSITNVLERLQVNYLVSNSENDLLSAQALLLPGVGAFGEAMRNIRAKDLDKILLALLNEKKIPVLGICLGMQLLMESSEENGQHTGLAILPGKVRAITSRTNLAVPHVGWNEVTWKSTSQLTTNIPAGAHFYFDHSYEVFATTEHCSASTNYGGNVTAVLEHANIFATQFHPEKSQINGLRVINNFLRAAGVVPC